MINEVDSNYIFCGRVPWLYHYWPGGFTVFVVLCPGTPEGSTGSCSGFKASQKTGQQIKVSSDRLGEAGNRTCDPWFTRHRFIPYNITFCGFPGYKPVPPVGLRFVCWFYDGTPKGSPIVVLWRSRESNLRPLVYKA